MSSLFNQYDFPKQLGSEIAINNSFPSIYVSESDEEHCFTAVLLNNKEAHQIRLHKHPYYMHGKHSTYKRFAASIKVFFVSQTAASSWIIMWIINMIITEHINSQIDLFDTRLLQAPIMVL
jgi:hypothetical protein